MPSSDREAQVLDAVVTLVDSLLHDFDIIELLTDLTDRCAQLLDVAAAGLLLADSRRQLHLLAATSERTEEVELLQLQADEGPCLDCYATGEAVSVADLRDVVDRWPTFSPAAQSGGFASVHAIPLRAAGTVLGALGLFGSRTGELNDADLLVGHSLAHVASVALVQGRAPTVEVVVPHLRSTLADQVVVEQAKGFLRERMDVTVGQAFALLRHYARQSDMHLSELARRLMSDPDARPMIMAGLDGLAEADLGR